MKAIRLVVLSLPLVVIACGSTPPPKELVDARAAYKRAAEGPAKDIAPAELHVAQQALDHAEKSLADDGDSPETKDRAYVAMRKAELAEAQARLSKAIRDKTDAQSTAQKLQTESLKQTQQELSKTKTQLEQERKAREEAEKRAAQALADLQRIAAVKQEARGMVITLSGAVLFASNQSELLPAAQVKLNEVAEALIKGNPDAKMTVEGHTDSQGQAGYNKDLSQKRAESVRSYLISRGIAADRIRAAGYGSERPVASNNTAEGRANNRRVEIVVEPSKG